MHLTRRAVLAAAVSAPAWASTDFSSLERRIQGRVGVFGLRGANVIANREHERFAYCSTFKWVLAAAVLQGVQQGQLTLEQSVKFTAKDLLQHAPITHARLSDGAMSVGALCEATVTTSDNTAANLLTPLVGGLVGLTKFVRALGDTVTRFDRVEPHLNSNRRGDARDTTSPKAMSQLLHATFTRAALNEASRVQLFGWLQSATTGLNRIRASAPTDWAVGDKTGTSGNGAVNDVAVLRPPEGEPLYLSVFVDAPKLTMAAGSDVIAEAAKLALAALS